MAAVHRNLRSASDRLEPFIAAGVTAAFDHDFAAVLGVGDPLRVGNGAVTRQRQLRAVGDKQGILQVRGDIISVQVDDRIGANRVLLRQIQVSCQADIFVGFFKSLFEIPYSTDISRGY